MKHRCAGCKERRDSYCLVGPRVHYCIDCARAAQITGGRPKNVAEENHRKWYGSDCTHQSQENRYVYEGRTRYLIGVCRRPNCGAEVFRVRADN